MWRRYENKISTANNMRVLKSAPTPIPTFAPVLGPVSVLGPGPSGFTEAVFVEEALHTRRQDVEDLFLVSNI